MFTEKDFEGSRIKVTISQRRVPVGGIGGGRGGGPPGNLQAVKCSLWCRIECCSALYGVL